MLIMYGVFSMCFTYIKSFNLHKKQREVKHFAKRHPTMVDLRFQPMQLYLRFFFQWVISGLWKFLFLGPSN